MCSLHWTISWLLLSRRIFTNSKYSGILVTETKELIFLMVFVLSILRSVLSKNWLLWSIMWRNYCPDFSFKAKLLIVMLDFSPFSCLIWKSSSILMKILLTLLYTVVVFFFSSSFAPNLRQILLKIVAVCFALQNSHLRIIIWVLVTLDCELNKCFIYLGKWGRGHWYWTSWKLVFTDFCSADMWLVLSIS